MSLWKRGDWYWTDFTLKGERFRLPLDTKDWREAGEREKELIAQAGEGKVSPRAPDLAKMKLSDALETYLSGLRGRIGEGSIRSERERLNQVVRRLGPTPLRQISAALINQYIADRVAEGRSGRTINMEIGALRRLLKRAKLWRRLCDDVKLLPQRSEIGRALMPEEKLRLISAAKQRPEWDNARLAMALALHTTMRSCEIRSLRWRDVDLMDQELTVCRSKTEAGRRTIPLNRDALAAILELRERAKILCGEPLSPDWYVFPHAEGSTKPDPTHPMKSWRTAWRKLTRAAGLAGLRFHDLRHHAITELAESQASDQTVMAIAGHLSRRMLEHYSHIRREAKRRAVTALETHLPVTQTQAAEGGYVTKPRHKMAVSGFATH
jgi:integrase